MFICRKRQYDYVQKSYINSLTQILCEKLKTERQKIPPKNTNELGFQKQINRGCKYDYDKWNISMETCDRGNIQLSNFSTYRYKTFGTIDSLLEVKLY